MIFICNILSIINGGVYYGKGRTEEFWEADEVREFPKGRRELIKIGGATIGRAIFQPGPAGGGQRLSNHLPRRKAVKPLTSGITCPACWRFAWMTEPSWSADLETCRYFPRVMMAGLLETIQWLSSIFRECSITQNRSKCFPNMDWGLRGLRHHWQQCWSIKAGSDSSTFLFKRTLNREIGHEQFWSFQSIGAFTIHQ